MPVNELTPWGLAAFVLVGIWYLLRDLGRMMTKNVGDQLQSGKERQEKLEAIALKHAELAERHIHVTTRFETSATSILHTLERIEQKLDRWGQAVVDLGHKIEKVD